MGCLVLDIQGTTTTTKHNVQSLEMAHEPQTPDMNCVEDHNVRLVPLKRLDLLHFYLMPVD